jgi:hypothetical protein
VQLKIIVSNYILSAIAASYEHKSTYNKTSCRSCGQRMTVMQDCHYCDEPIKWQCISCYKMDDRFHTHYPKNQVVNYSLTKRSEIF